MPILFIYCVFLKKYFFPDILILICHIIINDIILNINIIIQYTRII